MNNNNNETQTKQLGSIFLLLGWIIAIALLSLLFHKLFYAHKAASIQTNYKQTKITLHRDHDGHFRIKGNVNGVTVTFLIDTGASFVALSSNIAEQAQLSAKYEMTIMTANGPTKGYFTRIAELSFAPIIFEDISAIITPNLSETEGLLGMNILEKFHVEQISDQLILKYP